MKIAFFDTETTGFIKPNASHDEQPHCVQLAVLLTDDQGNDVDSYESIICPGDESPFHFIVPDRVAEIHGITTLRAIDEGKPLAEVVEKFAAVIGQADLIVAHNIDFDVVVMGTAYHRAGVMNNWSLLERFCTMKSLTDIIRLPKARGAGFKWPKLQESHLYYFNEGFEDAHSAMADVQACKRIYFEGKSRGHF